MRILLSAVACNPERGSEAHFGWNALCALSKRHEVCLLGHGADREALERAKADGRIGNNVRFAFTRQRPHWHRNRIISRLQAWRDYQAWCRDSLDLARRLHKESPFDLVHHVTMSSWRVATPLWRLGIPLVWGPIGGAETYPLRLYTQLSPASMAYEAFRSLLNFKSLWLDPGIRACVRHATILLASNPETARLLIHLSGHPNRVSLLSAAFFTEQQILALRRAAALPNPSPAQYPTRSSSKTKSPQILKLFAGGDIEGRKGIALALQALAQIKRHGIDFHYHMGGLGPEIAHLQRLADHLGISSHVTLGVPLRGHDYHLALREAHIYLLPSLRDNAPVTLMEAMLAGCVPIVADCGGPGMIVNNDSGIKIPVSSPTQMIQNLTDHLIKLAKNPDLITHMSHCASHHVANSYSEEAYMQKINALYLEATSKKP